MILMQHQFLISGERFSSLNNYDVITPFRVTGEGEFITNDVSHSHFDEKERSGRYKRSSDEYKIHYQIHLEGKPHIVSVNF